MNRMNYYAGSGELSGWIIEEQSFDARYLGKCEAVFAQGNGYLGMRNALEERYVGETRNLFVTGTFNKIDENEVTELPNLPDITNIDLTVNGKRFHLEQGTIHHYARTLNLKNGETVRNVEWTSPDGERVSMVFKRFVSMDDEHLAAQSMELTALSGDMDLTITSGIDGRVGNTGAQHFHEGQRRIYEGTFLELVAETFESGVCIAIHSANKLYGTDAHPFPIIDRRSLYNEYSVHLAKGESMTLEKLSSVSSSRDLTYCGKEIDDFAAVLKRDGMASLKNAYEKGYDRLLAESAKAWEEYWQTSDILVESTDQYDQLGLRFALYHLRIMVKPDDNRVGIGAKAMTGEGYKGHSFWDTEIFILPYFTFTHPQTARTLLEYRFNSLPGARRKAKENGFCGAMYPWESAWLDDGEVTPLWGAADIVTGEQTKILTGLIEHHITADIAYAVWQYYTMTDDHDFMERFGYQIVLECAQFWCSRVEYNKELDRYEITDVIGPDEYKEHVDNNAYTNYLVHYNFQLARGIAESLQNTELYKKLDDIVPLAALCGDIERIIDKLYLPAANEDGIIPQTDQYLGLKEIDLSKYKNDSSVLGIYRDYNVEQINGLMVSKQADLVVLFYLLDDLFGLDVKRRNFLFYEAHTLHDSSLSKSTHSLLANDFGLSEMAYGMYQSALDIDLGQNMKTSDAGIHSASMGGLWQAVVMGFGGVRLKKGQLHISPNLPAQWTRLAFSIMWKGCQLRVSIGDGKLSVSNSGTHAVTAVLCGEEAELFPQAECAVPVERQVTA